MLKLLFVLCSFTFAACSSFSPTLKSIEDSYGVKIISDYSPLIFPAEWRNAKIPPVATQIDPDQLERYDYVLNVAFRSYPKSVIRKNLKNVYLLGSLTIFGVSAGGTYSDDSLYLVGFPEERGYTDLFLIEFFHHEFSSILLKNYKLDEAKWSGTNPRWFKYGRGGIDAIRRGHASLVGTPELYQNGFLSEYSMSSIEEDFNVFSQKVFARPALMSARINRYPYLKKKFTVWAEFYSKIDSRLTEERLLSGYRFD
jgi:hypothetical protein